MMLFENVSNLAKDTCPAIDDDFLLHPNAKRRAPFDAASPAFVRQNPRQCLCYAFSCTELQRLPVARTSRFLPTAIHACPQ